MKVARLIIRDYAGVEAADIKVPPGGILITGGNARGKTSIYRALRAALKAQGVDPDAIRQGAEKSEILVDLSSLHVRTIIRPKGEETVVMDESGQVQRKPRTILNDLFGDELDPLAFYQAKDKDRRRMIYEVLPMKVTAEDMARWTNTGLALWTGLDMSEPGLEVVARHRLQFYNQRAQANAKAEASAATAQRLQAEWGKLLSETGPTPTEKTSVEDAQRLREEAQRALSALEGKQQGFEQARRAAGPTREKIERLRAEAAKEVIYPLVYSSMPAQSVASDRAMGDLIAVVDEYLQRLKKDALSLERRRNLTGEVTSLEASLAGVESMNVPAEEVTAARAALTAAEGVLVRARGVKIYAGYLSAAEEAAKQAAADAAAAAALDAVVRNLTTVAPRELAERSGGIPGLVVGEKITLDKVVLDDLAGIEQLQFAVNLAKRVRGSKGKVLLVDKLEAIDEDELGAFLKMAVQGGWQLIGTRVTKGELQILAIAGDEEVDDG